MSTATVQEATHGVPAIMRGNRYQPAQIVILGVDNQAVFPARLEQVFVNLIANALKYRGDENPVVTKAVAAGIAVLETIAGEARSDREVPRA